MTTNIRAWGNSQGLYIPKSALKQVGLEVDDSVEISVEGEAIMIRKDNSRDEKKKALESLRALREEIKAKGISINSDYKKELEEYFDEKYEI